MYTVSQRDFDTYGNVSRPFAFVTRERGQKIAFRKEKSACTRVRAWCNAIPIWLQLEKEEGREREREEGKGELFHRSSFVKRVSSYDRIVKRVARIDRISIRNFVLSLPLPSSLSPFRINKFKERRPVFHGRGTLSFIETTRLALHLSYRRTWPWLIEEFQGFPCWAAGARSSVSPLSTYVEKRAILSPSLSLWLAIIACSRSPTPLLFLSSSQDRLCSYFRPREEKREKKKKEEKEERASTYFENVVARLV